MDTFLTLLKNPLTIVIMIALLAHASFVAISSYVRYRQNKKKADELAKSLRESEKRVQSIFYSMDKNRQELLSSLDNMNKVLIDEIEEKAKQEKPKPDEQKNK
ncbi:hypothetical protein ACFLZV_05800 [Candidatus Margulisiibacteriota bacterium]